MDVLSNGSYATDRRLLESSTENLSDNNNSINSENIRSVLHGSAVLAGGGGGGFAEALEMYRSLNPDAVEVRALDELPEDSNLATVFGLSPVDHSTSDPIEIARRSLELYESHYGEIDGIVLGEVGPDLVVEALAVADELDIPVVDADVAGMRAVPSIQNEIIEGSGLERTPIVAASDQDHTVIESGSGQELEEEIRDLAENSIWYVTGYTGRPEEFSEPAVEGWFSEALSLERAEVERIGTGQFRSVTTEEFEGHTVGRITVQGEECIEVFLQNENILAYRDGGLVASAPDIITVIDENGRPVYNGRMPEEGQQVEVYMINHEFWSSTEVLDIRTLDINVSENAVTFQDQIEFDIRGETDVQ